MVEGSNLKMRKSCRPTTSSVAGRVGGHPGHEVPLPERGGLAVRDGLHLGRHVEMVPGFR